MDFPSFPSLNTLKLFEYLTIVIEKKADILLWENLRLDQIHVFQPGHLQCAKEEVIVSDIARLRLSPNGIVGFRILESVFGRFCLILDTCVFRWTVLSYFGSLLLFSESTSDFRVHF